MQHGFGDSEIKQAVCRGAGRFKYMPCGKQSACRFVAVTFLYFTPLGIYNQKLIFTRHEYIEEFKNSAYHRAIDMCHLDDRFGHGFDYRMIKKLLLYKHNSDGLYSRSYIAKYHKHVNNILDDMKYKHLKRHDGHKQLRKEKTNSKMKLTKCNMLCDDLNNEIFKFLGWTK
jgi:hypothetical protein